MGIPLRCRLGLHRWTTKWDHEKGRRYQECTLCGDRIGTGWPTSIG